MYLERLLSGIQSQRKENFAITYSKPEGLAIFLTEHKPLAFSLHVPKLNISVMYFKP
jgi:hypothetical protein